MREKDYLKWSQFLNGDWTKIRPNLPGEYPVADRAGKYIGTIHIYINSLTKKPETTESCGWKSWFWSYPIPKLPKPPKWARP